MKLVQCPICNIFKVDATIPGWSKGSNVVCCRGLGVPTAQSTLVIVFRTMSGSSFCHKHRFLAVS